MRPTGKPKYTIFKVKETCTLLPFIMKCLDGISRSKAKAILSGGGVRVNKKNTTQHDLPLQVGMVVEISKHKERTPFQSPFLKIVYEDQAIIVIDKNPGILSMGKSAAQFCVKTVLDNYFKKSRQKCTAHVVHRLDRETSGLLVYAKTMEAEQILEHNWSQIVTDRRYYALASGQLSQKEGVIESYLKDGKDYITRSSKLDNGGKFARTYYRCVKQNEAYSLVELRLDTGRKNQIRVHLQDLGHPVCGDIKYGNGDNPCNRLCLHAYRLNFYHPITHEHLRFDSPVPKVFNQVFKTQE